jgi:hypothetical protein
MVADPDPKNAFPDKRFIFTCQKNSALALHTESLDQGFPPVKSRKFDQKRLQKQNKKPKSSNEKNFKSHDDYVIP